jgi:hypothetical protein
MSSQLFNWILGLLFLTGFLIMVQYIRSREGFANPDPIPYKYESIFAAWPVEKTCIYWNQEYQKIVKSFTLDDLGKPVPEDIAKQNADKIIKTYIVTGPIVCPVHFPPSDDIDTVANFVKELDPMLLAKVYMTLIFITGQSRLAITNLKKSMKNLPKREAFTDLFLTECSLIELMNQSTVPLQCINSATEKATEKEIRLKQDPVETKRIAKLREQLSQQLATLQQNASNFHSSYISSVNQTYMSLIKQIAQLETSKQKLEEKKSDNEEIIKQMEVTMKKIGEALAKARNEKDLYEIYKQIMYMTPDELLADYEKNLEQVKQIQKKIESGDFTNL